MDGEAPILCFRCAYRTRRTLGGVVTAAPKAVPCEEITRKSVFGTVSLFLKCTSPECGFERPLFDFEAAVALNSGGG